MTSRSAPHDPTAQYQEFWNQLCRAQPKLDKLITGQIFVQWGHETPNQGTPIREDQQLTRAELFLREQVAYEKVRAKPGPNNVTLSGLFGNEIGVPILRQLVQKIREGVVMFGLGDVVYYCAEDGERHVREQVYNQVLGRLDPYLKEKDVRLHIFGHSLGVTISHDFLYGLFAPRHKPDFVREKQGGGRCRQCLHHVADQGAQRRTQAWLFGERRFATAAPVHAKTKTGYAFFQWTEVMPVRHRGRWLPDKMENLL